MHACPWLVLRTANPHAAANPPAHTGNPGHGRDRSFDPDGDTGGGSAPIVETANTP